MNTSTQTTTWATVSGGIALALSIIGFLVPVVGSTIIAPIGALLGAGAIYGGAKNLGIAVFVITLVNYIISVSWWAVWSLNGMQFLMGPISILALILMIVALFMRNR